MRKESTVRVANRHRSLLQSSNELRNIIATYGKRAAVPLLLVLIVVGFFWKLTLTNQFSWLESPDMANQVLPWQQVQAAAIHEGKLPLWDPYLWGGQSLIGQVQPGSAYPLNWLLYLLPLRHGFIKRGYLNWYFVLIHAQAALFAYWLCRDLGRSRVAALIAGLAFGLGGAVGTTDWPQILNGIVWIPVILMFFLRAVHGRRPYLSAALCGFTLGISWLSGHHQVPLYYSLALAGLWAFQIFRGGTVKWRVLGLAGIFAAFLAATSALQVLPALQYGHLAARWAGAPEPLTWKQVVPYSVLQQGSLGLATLFGIVIPGIAHFATPYVGFLGLSLAAIGVAVFWEDAPVRLLAVLAMAGLFFSLGYQDVFHGFLYAVIPMIEKAREPAMAVVIFHFGASVLVAYGFDALRSRKDRLWPRRIAFWLLGAGVSMFALVLGIMLAKKLQFDFDDRVVLIPMLALITGGLFLAYQKGNFGAGSLGTVCILLLLIDLGNSTGYAYVHYLDKNRAVYLNKYSANQDILQWIRKQPGRFVLR